MTNLHHTVLLLWNNFTSLHFRRLHKHFDFTLVNIEEYHSLLETRKQFKNHNRGNSHLGLSSAGYMAAYDVRNSTLHFRHNSLTVCFKFKHEQSYLSMATKFSARGEI